MVLKALCFVILAILVVTGSTVTRTGTEVFYSATSRWFTTATETYLESNSTHVVTTEFTAQQFINPVSTAYFTETLFEDSTETSLIGNPVIATSPVSASPAIQFPLRTAVLVLAVLALIVCLSLLYFMIKRRMHKPSNDEIFEGMISS